MMSKTFRPATSWEGERAERDHLAWQQLFLDNSKTPPLAQQLSVTSYTVDDCLNVINLNFAPLLGELRSWS